MQGIDRRILVAAGECLGAAGRAVEALLERANPGFWAGQRPVSILAAGVGLVLLVIGLLHFEAFRTIQGLVLPLVTALLVIPAAPISGMLGYVLARKLAKKLPPTVL